MRLLLTERGRKANAQRSGTYEAAVRRVLASTSEQERNAAEALLTRLASALRDTVEEHVAGKFRVG